MSSTPKKITWYILGAGAIGSLWACYWRKAGFPVTLITRTEQTRSPLYLNSPQQSFSVDVETITPEQLSASKKKIQHLFISTKAQDTITAINSIKSQLTPHATVLTLQNGMAIEPLSTLLPTQQLITAISDDGVYRSNKNNIIHAGQGCTHIGCEEKFLQQLPTDFLHIKSCNDITVQQWKKLAINSTINGLTAIYYCKNGALLSNSKAYQQLKSLCAEIVTIANAAGMGEHCTDLEQQVTKTLTDTAENYSSMHQDIKEKRKTEIDFINGYLIKIAEQHAISCEKNKILLFKIKKLEKS